MPMGAMLYGWLATAFDVRVLLLASALGYAGLSLATLAAPSVRGLRQAELQAADGSVGPSDAP